MPHSTSQMQNTAVLHNSTSAAVRHRVLSVLVGNGTVEQNHQSTHYSVNGTVKPWKAIVQYPWQGFLPRINTKVKERQYIQSPRNVAVPNKVEGNLTVWLRSCRTSVAQNFYGTRLALKQGRRCDVKRLLEPLCIDSPCAPYVTDCYEF